MVVAWSCSRTVCRCVGALFCWCKLLMGAGGGALSAWAIFMLAASWTLLADKHVRIDAFSNRFSARQRSRIEKLGIVFLLFPMMMVILVSSFGYVLESWSIMEGSLEISGLPGRFLVKSLIPVFALLMVLAAVAKLPRRL